MGVVAGLQSLMTNVPRYAIETHAGTAALGYFAGIAYLVLAGNQAVMALWAAASPRCATIRDDRRLASHGANAVTRRHGGLTVGAAAVGAPLLAVSAPGRGHADVPVWLRPCGRRSRPARHDQHHGGAALPGTARRRRHGRVSGSRAPWCRLRPAAGGSLACWCRRLPSGRVPHQRGVAATPRRTRLTLDTLLAGACRRGRPRPAHASGTLHWPRSSGLGAIRADAGALAPAARAPDPKGS
jgi:hypothetical protein